MEGPESERYRVKEDPLSIVVVAGNSASPHDSEDEKVKMTDIAHESTSTAIAMCCGGEKWAPPVNHRKLIIDWRSSLQ